MPWRSASLTGTTPHVQSRCKAKGKKAHRSILFIQSPHCAILPSALLADPTGALCTFGYFIKGAAILTAASCPDIR